MLVIFIRTLIIFITLIIVMRIMGKRQIGEMQPFEFIITLIIADLACIPMADVSIPLIYGIVAIIGLFLLHQVISILESSSIFKRVISGKPSLVINTDGVDMKELKRNNLGIDDLIEAMRGLGYFSLDDLRYAIFESNGNLSPMENSERTEQIKSVPLLIINNGKINKKNISLMHCDQSDIEQLVKKDNKLVKDVEVMTIDGNGRTYVKYKKQKYRIVQFNLKEGVKW